MQEGVSGVRIREWCGKLGSGRVFLFPAPLSLPRIVPPFLHHSSVSAPTAHHLYGFQEITVDSIIPPCGYILAGTSPAATIKPAHINVAATLVVARWGYPERSIIGIQGYFLKSVLLLTKASLSFTAPLPAYVIWSVNGKEMMRGKESDAGMRK